MRTQWFWKREALALFLGMLSMLSSAAAKAAALKPADIFQTTNVWDIHLTVSPDQWKAMEAKQGPRPTRPPGAKGISLQGPEGGRNGFLAAAGVVFNYVHADLEFGTNVFKDVGLRYKGNGTFMTSHRTLKRSLKIDLNEFVQGQKLAGMSQLNLHNCIRDPGSMNEAIAYGLFNKAGVPASRTAFARVFVTVPGKHEKQFFGLYSLVEDVGKEFLEEKIGEKKGALLKPVTPSLFGDLGDDWKSYNQTYDPKGTLTEQQKQRVIGFAKLVTHANDAEFARQLPEYLDLENFARYMAMTTWLVDMDGILGIGQNYYVYLHPKTQKFMFVPWDQDQTFGQFPRGSTAKERERLSIDKPWSDSNRFLERVFKHEEFRKLYRARLQEFNKTICRPEQIALEVDRLAPILRPDVKRESSDRLAQFDRAAAGKTVEIFMGPVGSGKETVKSIKAFVRPRHESVQDQLAGKARGEVISSGL